MASSTKNAAPTHPPPVIFEKTSGSTTKASAGPRAGSRPKLNTAGKITRPAVTANKVSPNAMPIAAAGSRRCGPT